MPNKLILSCDDCKHCIKIMDKPWCKWVHKDEAPHQVPPELYADMVNGDYQCMYSVRNPEGSRKT